MIVHQNNADWLVWCYACHHGGHYSHITNWFKTHRECPVNGCTYHCCEIYLGVFTWKREFFLYNHMCCIKHNIVIEFLLCVVHS